MYKAPKYLSFIREGHFILHLVTQTSAREEKKRRQVESTRLPSAGSAKSQSHQEALPSLGAALPADTFG